MAFVFLLAPSLSATEVVSAEVPVLEAMLDG